MKPLHQHDCDACQYITTIDSMDAYICPHGMIGPTAVVRFSSDGPDYASNPVRDLNRAGLVLPYQGVMLYAYATWKQQRGVTIEELNNPDTFFGGQSTGRSFVI